MVSQSEDQQVDFNYFYVVYWVGPMLGNIVLKQHLNKENPGDFSFNFAAAHDYISNKIQAPVLISFWTQTNKKRYDQWLAFLKEKTGPAPDNVIPFDRH